MFDKLKKFAKEDTKNKYPYLLIGIALVVGIMMTYLPRAKEVGVTNVKMPTSGQPKAILNQAVVSESYEQQLEKRLVRILQQMEGVGQVDVMVTIASNEEKVYAEEKIKSTESQEEEDSEGGKRKLSREDWQSKLTMQSGDTPVVVKENKPQIEGVLVLAQGAGNSEIKNKIIESVSSLLNVPVHKISVFKRK